jgi:hypothetical protein
MSHPEGGVWTPHTGGARTSSSGHPPNSSSANVGVSASELVLVARSERHFITSGVCIDGVSMVVFPGMSVSGSFGGPGIWMSENEERRKEARSVCGCGTPQGC